MGSFLIDLHVHTKETSACGEVSAAQTVKLYQEAGYNGIVITDHFHARYFNSLGAMPWQEKIDHYLRGSRLALDAAKGTEFKVFSGIEFRNNETDDDFLVYGLDEDFLIQNSDLFDIPLKQALKRFHDVNAIVIQAHPVRIRLAMAMGDRVFEDFNQPAMLAQLKAYPDTPQIPYSMRMTLLGLPQRPTFLRVCHLREPELLDGIEAYNGNVHWCQDPVEIDDIHKQYPNLILTSASDFHEPCHLARGGMVLDRAPKNTLDLTEILRSKHIISYHTSNNFEIPGV